MSEHMKFYGQRNIFIILSDQISIVFGFVYMRYENVEWQSYVVVCKVRWSHKWKNNRFYVFLVIWSTVVVEERLKYQINFEVKPKTLLYQLYWESLLLNNNLHEGE